MRRSEPVTTGTANFEFEIDRILAHRIRGKGFRWEALLKGAAQQEVEWKSTKEFIHDDGTATVAFYNYIQ